MSELVRLYRYRDLLRGGRSVSKARLMAETEVSAATFKRDLQKLRDQLNVPIEFDRETGGYVLRDDAASSELPGMWFSSDEIIGLATIQTLLVQLAPSLMSSQLKLIQERLNQLIRTNGIEPNELASRIVMTPYASRTPNTAVFSVVVRATLEQKRLVLTHHNRRTDETTTREVSPVCIEHYRDNWYLSSWCHTRNDLRRFSIDAIENAQVLNQSAEMVDDETRRAKLQSSYGIFSGVAVQWASIRFTPNRAKWVATEMWHPMQRTTTESSGHLTLEVPYSDDRELVADILRHGTEAEVLEPEALRNSVIKLLKATLARYS